MDPIEFIKNSTLKHSSFFGKDKVLNQQTNNWEQLNTKCYKPPLNVLNKYCLSRGKNCRPHDKNGSDFTVYLESDSNLIGNKEPSGRVPSFTFTGKNGTKQYWLFYGYDYSKVCGLNFSHQGDWESVTLKIMNNQIEGAWLSAHGNDKYYNRKDLEVGKDGNTEILYVYSAKGSHAVYNKPGDFHIFKSDHTAEGGSEWIITDCELDLKAQPWIKFAGAWGTSGHLASTTGPLGPMFKINPAVNNREKLN